MLDHPTEEQLALYADGLLFGEATSFVAAHLAECQHCFQAIISVRNSRDLEEVGLCSQLSTAQAEDLARQLKPSWKGKLQLLWDGTKGVLRKGSNAEPSGSAFLAGGLGLMGGAVGGKPLAFSPNFREATTHLGAHPEDNLLLPEAPGRPDIHVENGKLVFCFTNELPSQVRIAVGNSICEADVPPTGIVEVDLSSLLPHGLEYAEVTPPDASPIPPHLVLDELSLEIIDIQNDVRFLPDAASMISESMNETALTDPQAITAMPDDENESSSNEFLDLSDTSTQGDDPSSIDDFPNEEPHAPGSEQE